MAGEIDFTQIKKKYEDPTKKFPGNMKVGMYPGCAVKVFTDHIDVSLTPPLISTAAEQMTKFFEENAGMIIADWSGSAVTAPIHRQDMIVVLNSITVFYTTLLTEDERDVITVRQQVLEEEIQKRLDAMRESEEKAAEEESNRKKKEQELMKKGQKCEHDHGGIAKEREELTKLKKLVRKEAPELLKKIKLNEHGETPAEEAMRLADEDAEKK